MNQENFLSSFLPHGPTCIMAGTDTSLWHNTHCLTEHTRRCKWVSSAYRSAPLVSDNHIWKKKKEGKKEASLYAAVYSISGNVGRNLSMSSFFLSTLLSKTMCCVSEKCFFSLEAVPVLLLCHLFSNIEKLVL